MTPDEDEFTKRLEEWRAYEEALRRYEEERTPGEPIDIFDPDLPVPPPGYMPTFDAPPPPDR